jgi:transposase-like protein
MGTLRDFQGGSRSPQDSNAAATVEAAASEFADFAGAWRPRYPAMVETWERSWPEFVPFPQDFPPDSGA